MIRTLLIGVGGMARSHLPLMLQPETETEIVAICEPSAEAYALTSTIFENAGLPVPPNIPDLDALLSQYAGKLDAAFIITPHALHLEQAQACLNAGLDVLLEKPMVINAQEAMSLIETRDRTGKLLVVAFQGGLSPQIRAASAMLRSGELGELLSISGTVWQNWNHATIGTWRQQPALSGGGFLFDTGAHMLNTISDLAGEDFAEVAAWLDNRGTPVEILGAVMARLQSGALVTINACGDAIPSCESEIRVFCTQGILFTGQWGERLLLQRAGDTEPVPVDLPPMRGAWEQFTQVRAGLIPNPSPPEVGLRMAKLWDAINVSARQGGHPVSAS